MTDETDPESDEALSRVLDALAAGDPVLVERLSATYPGLHLDHLAAVAGEVEGSLLEAPAPATRARHLRRLMEEATRLRTVPAAPTAPAADWARPKRSRRRARIATVLGALVALALLAIPATAALASNAQPGQPLYGARLLLEKVELVAQRDPAKRVALRLKFSQQRMAEVEKLVQRGRTAEAGAIAQKLVAQQSAIQSTLQQALRAHGGGKGKLSPQLLQLIQGLRASLGRHTADLNALAARAGCPSHPTTSECTALASAQANTARILRRLASIEPLPISSPTPAVYRPRTPAVPLRLARARPHPSGSPR
jgi:hypothetical protein